MAMIFGGNAREDSDYYRQEAIDIALKLEKLRQAVRKHRDQKGDDRCWMDDEELYKALPEGYEPPVRDSRVELCNCVKYIESRHNPATTYVSPEREIEKLRAEVKRLEDYRNKFEEIVTRCRNIPGPCFCGVHISYVSE